MTSHHHNRMNIPGDAVDDPAGKRSRIAPAGMWRNAGHRIAAGMSDGAAELLYFTNRLFFPPGIPALGKAPRAYPHLNWSPFISKFVTLSQFRPKISLKSGVAAEMSAVSIPFRLLRPATDAFIMRT